MFDSHCHLQDKRIFGRVDEIVRNARNVGVGRMLCCGSEAADWADVARIGAGYGGAVVCAYGVHPWYVGGTAVDNTADNGNGADKINGANSINNDWMAALEKYLTNDPSAAVGEIGLDHTVSPRNDDCQKDIFIRQLKIAERHKRPVSIHCRKAWGDLLSILRDTGGLRYGGAIHSYSGPPDLVGQLEDMGCSISFSGSILIPGSRRAAESVRKVSPRKLLAETDSPDILPQGAPGPHNEPLNLPMVINRMAEILGETPENIAASTHSNATALFC
ncbi:MAG: TatD family hydrolase [Chitinispirillia bacterium]|nr:TatD family hydrolase [Chitinispirillia bacterium]MCL2242132.1 TatD family hydrolase [Chitinispirillia bacterium]